MTFTTPGSLRLAGTLLLLASLSVGMARAADPEPKINVSEICTTCQDVIRCVRDPGSPVPAYPAVVYYLAPHTFWEQVVTIWDYLIRFGKPKLEDTRALTVYEYTTADGPAARAPGPLAADLSAVTMTIEVPGARIDRNSGQWSVAGAAGAGPLRPAGSCSLLPVADGYAFLRANPPAS
jgi:hypothetical protein